MDFAGGEAILDDGANLYPFQRAFTTGVTQTVTIAMDAFNFTLVQYGDGFRADFQQFGNLIAGADFGDEFQDARGHGLFPGLHSAPVAGDFLQPLPHIRLIRYRQESPNGQRCVGAP
jgi:hypothetical protein